jgi:PAS domain S-box-containing protein
MIDKKSTEIFIKAKASENSVKFYRIFMFVMAFFYPVWGYIAVWLKPRLAIPIIEPVEQRVYLCFFCLFVLILTYFFKPVKDKIILLFNMLAWLFTAHFFYLLQLNHLNFLYLVGSFVLIISIASTFTFLLEVIPYSLFVLTLAIHIPETNYHEPTIVFILSMATVLVFFNIGVIAKNNTQKTKKSISAKLRKTLRLLDESNQNNQSLLESIHDGFFHIDSNWIITYFNKEAETLLNYPKAAMENQLFTDVFNYDIEAYKKVAIKNERIRFESFNNNGNRILDVSVYPSSQGGLSFYFKDISDKKKTEQMISNNATLSALGSMALGLAHEINNPLSILQVNSEIIQASLDEGQVLKKEQTQYYVKVIESTIDRISKILKSLQIISHKSIDKGFKKQNLKKIIESSFCLYRERFNKDNIDIQLTIPDDLEIFCLDSELAQTFVSLITNSIDSMATVTKRWIKVSVTDLDNSVTISIMDSGATIPESIQDKIFLPFFSTKDVSQGSGLGLSIAKGLVEIHQGTICHNNKSINTEFIIQLPKNPKAA